MRSRYRRRRDTLVASLAEVLPEVRVQGIAAGLHAAVRLPETDDEEAILAEARRQRVTLATMASHRMRRAGPPTLLLGYAQAPEPTIRAGVREVAAIVRATRSQMSP
jgi:GntR family transcriptional regulator / MocR family aminotransferase